MITCVLDAQKNRLIETRVQASLASLRCVLEHEHSPSLVLVQPRKTRPFITERLLMGRKESNQTKKFSNIHSYLEPCNNPFLCEYSC